MTLPLPIAEVPTSLSLDRSTLAGRRRGGVVYTPSHLAEFVLALAGYPASRPMTLLDPACGEGIFLEIALAQLSERMQAAGIPLDQPPGRRVFLARVEATMFAVDIDPRAVESTRRAVRDLTARICGQEPPEDFFAANVRCADFLTSAGLNDLPPARSGGFDYIVGNPPYVSTQRIAPTYKRLLRAAFVTAHGRLDLYTLFIERSLQLLARSGRLAFITPDKFLVSKTARPLRHLLLSRGAVRTVARFRSHRVFRDAATVPCVTVFERGSSQGPIELLECAIPQDASKPVVVERTSSIRPGELAAHGEWTLATPTLKHLSACMLGGHPRLSTLVARISAGLATGRDNAYVVSVEACKGLEQDLLRPAVRGRDLSPFAIHDPKLRVIVPYTYSVFGPPQLANLRDFPGVMSYLEARRSDLETRHCVRVWKKAWYDLHDPVSRDLCRTPKILVPDVANRNRFAIDELGYCPLHSVYYIVPDRGVDPAALTAILNSTPIEFLIRLWAPIVKDGFSRYRKQFLENLPIPWLDAAAQRSLLQGVERNDREHMDTVVAEAFGLSAVNLERIRSFLSSRSSS